MNVKDIRTSAIAKVKELMKDGKVAHAREIVSLFKVGADASSHDLAFHGKLLVLARQYISAEKVLRRAYSKNPTSDTAKDLETAFWISRTDKQFREMRSGVALDHLLKIDDISTVLDVGSGGGEHALVFASAGKKVDAVDLGRSVYFEKGAPEEKFSSAENVNFIKADFKDFDTRKKYDLVWCSHVLEHQVNSNAFLSRCLEYVENDKWLAVTVPPLKHSIVGGHVSLWNAGLLIYQLVMAGNDCSDAVVMNYDYNISVIVKKRTILLPALDYDAGDIDRLAAYFPTGCSEGFDGRMNGAVASISSNE